MSNIKDNDIDDLFKRASDKYPLRTDSADWDKLAAALEKDPSRILPPVATEGDRRRRRGFFWLFLLLPLGGVGYYVATHAGSKPGIQAATPGGTAPVGATQTGAAPAGTTASAPAASIAANRKTPDASVPVGGADPSKATAATDPSIASTSPSGVGRGSASGSRDLAAGTGASATVKATRTKETATNETKTKGTGTKETATKETTTKEIKAKRTKTKGAGTKGTATSSDPGDDAREASRLGAATGGGIPSGAGTAVAAGPGLPSAAGTGVAAGGSIGATGISSKAVERAMATGGRSPLNIGRADITEGIAIQITVDAKNSPVSANNGTKTAKKPAASNKKQSFFYAGLLVAPDLSTVKMQSVKGVGTTFGVLLGYQLNRRWAVETGAYLDHKKYYTDGEYFKEKSPNPNYNLLTVDGTCNMWEIPINIRYNLSTGPKAKWFATAGLSTYLMTHENYVSTSSWYGSTTTSDWAVKTPSQYWFSVINLSIGYEQKLGKIGNLRIEPYLKVPLSGIGTGSLPIMSAGLNIGITRKIW